MLFRESPSATIAIPQPGHAWLSGQIIRAWGNAAFGQVTPYEDVCLGAEQHDIGWLIWEQEPTLNLKTGRPHSFRETDVATHTAIWRQGTKMALALGRYPALLVSLHGTGLYTNFDFAAAAEPHAAIVRDFLDGQRAIQRRILASLREDERLREYSTPDMVERNRRLVRAADRMSIAICTGMRDIAIRSDNPREAIVRQVPLDSGETDIVLRALDRDLTAISATPWPFAAVAVHLTCEGLLLPPRPFQDHNEMRAAMENAVYVTLSAELRPG